MFSCQFLWLCVWLRRSRSSAAGGLCYGSVRRLFSLIYGNPGTVQKNSRKNKKKQKKKLRCPFRLRTEMARIRWLKDLYIFKYFFYAWSFAKHPKPWRLRNKSKYVKLSFRGARDEESQHTVILKLYYKPPDPSLQSSPSATPWQVARDDIWEVFTG